MGTGHRQGDAVEAGWDGPGHSCLFHATHTVGERRLIGQIRKGTVLTKSAKATDNRISQVSSQLAGQTRPMRLLESSVGADCVNDGALCALKQDLGWRASPG